MSDNSFRTILLVEYRDEVFARLAGDFAAMGIRAERACSAGEAFRRFARCSPDLMIANADLPYESGWLFAAKFRLVRPTARIWLYAPRPSWSAEYDHGLARCLGLAGLIHYQGDLLWLAEEIHFRLTRPPKDVRLADQRVAAVWPHLRIPTWITDRRRDEVESVFSASLATGLAEHREGEPPQCSSGRSPGEQ